MFNTKEWKDLRKFPSNICGLYYFYIKEKIVYIGRAIDIRQRLNNHFDPRKKHLQPQINYDKITKIKVVEGKYDDEDIEIDNYKPKWNRIGNYTFKRDDDLLCSFCNQRHGEHNKKCEDAMTKDIFMQFFKNKR